MLSKNTIVHVGKTKIDLFDFINQNSEFFKKQYLEVVFNLGNFQVNNQKLKKRLEFNGYSFWEMSLVQEKNIYKNNLAFNTIKYFALRKIIKDNTKENIKIFFLEYEIQQNLKKEFKDNNILFFDNQFTIIGLINKTIKKNILFNFIFFLYYFFKNCNFTYSKKNIYSKKKFFIFSYFTHYDIKKFSDNIFYPKQWSNLWELIHKESNFIQIFLPSKKIKFFFQIKRILKKKNFINLRNENFINSIIFLKNLKEVINDYKLIKSKINYPELEEKLKRDENFKFFYEINKEIFISSFVGLTLLQNLLWIRVFENLFKELPKHDYGIYLFENQPWEKALIKSWRKFNQGELIGYSHTTINYWHLNYFNHPKYNASDDFINYYPDFIAVSSDTSKNFLIDQSIDKKKIIEVEALRYNWIKDKKDIKNIKQNRKILFLGDYEPEINNKLVFIINQIKVKLLNLGFEISFKPHPATIPKNLSKNINLTHDDIEYLVDKHSYVVSSNSTSAIIEVLSCGLNTFLFIDKNNFDLSPVKNTKIEKKINFFYNDQELLDKIISSNNYFKNINYYYLDKNLEKWKKTLRLN